MIWIVIAFISSIIAAFMIGLFVGAVRDNDQHKGTILDDNAYPPDFWDKDPEPKPKKRPRTVGHAGPAGKAIGKAGLLEDPAPKKIPLKKKVAKK